MLNTFSDCGSLTSIIIPNGVITICDYTFDGCSSLTSLTIPNSITSIGEGTFTDCSSLSSVTIPNSVTSIGYIAFAGCRNISSVYISDLSAWCKIKCDTNAGPFIPSTYHLYINGVELKQLTIPNDISSIGNYAFYGCSYIASIIIPNNVTTIGESAFQNCIQAEYLKMPEYLQIIKKATFKGCNSLKTVIIPSTVEFIYQEAFADCSALSNIYALPSTPPYIYNNTFSNYSVPVNVPNESVEAYSTHDIWQNFNNIVGIPAENNITMNKVCGDYWATFFSSVSNYQADVNTTVYTATKEGNMLNLVEVTDRIVKAGEGIILKSTSSTATLTLTATAATDRYFNDNVLEGVDEATAQATGNTYYVLSNENSKLGFYKYTGTLGANKAFISVTDSNAPTFYDISDWTTGVNSTYKDNREVSNDMIYNLNGQRVIAPQKGFYIINGHKVIK